MDSLMGFRSENREGAIQRHPYWSPTYMEERESCTCLLFLSALSPYLFSDGSLHFLRNGMGSRKVNASSVYFLLCSLSWLGAHLQGLLLPFSRQLTAQALLRAEMHMSRV